jgi:hypothetical protein
MAQLGDAEQDVTTLTAAVGAARPAVSQHLAKLRLAGAQSPPVARTGRDQASARPRPPNPRSLRFIRRGAVRRR